MGFKDGNLTRVPIGYWLDTKNQRNFMEMIRKTLNNTNHEGFYSLSTTSLIRQGGTSLLRTYNGSLFKLLSSVYPEYLLHLVILHYMICITGITPNSIVFVKDIGMKCKINDLLWTILARNWVSPIRQGGTT